MIEGYHYTWASTCHMNIDKIKSKENYNYAIRINEIWQLRKFKITCLSGPILCSSDIQRMVHNTEKWRNPLLMIPEKSQYNKLKKIVDNVLYIVKNTYINTFKNICLAVLLQSYIKVIYGLYIFMFKVLCPENQSCRYCPWTTITMKIYILKL